jgi:phage gp45-like
MSDADQTVAEARHQFSSGNRNVLGMIRRMVVTVTSGSFWQVVGHLLIDGVTRETRQAEPFGVIGFYGRPAPGAKAEAIVCHCGAAAELPVIVAVRDERSRRRFANIEQDETIMYDSKSSIHIKADGTVSIRNHGGAERRLAFVEELNDLRAWTTSQFTAPGHTHGVSGGATTSVLAFDAGGTPDEDYPGTVVLKTE